MRRWHTVNRARRAKMWKEGGIYRMPGPSQKCIRWGDSGAPIPLLAEHIARVERHLRDHMFAMLSVGGLITGTNYTRDPLATLGLGGEYVVPK